MWTATYLHILLVLLLMTTAHAQIGGGRHIRSADQPASTSMKIWYLGSDDVDEHGDLDQNDTSRLISAETLNLETGVEFWEIDLDTADNVTTLTNFTKLKIERNWESEDNVTLHGAEDVNGHKFWKEHFHQIEAVRYITEGSGIWDVRDKNDNYIRFRANKNSLVVLPAGLYHRFVVPTGMLFQCRRLFEGNPVWTAFWRDDGVDVDRHPARLNYLAKYPTTKGGNSGGSSIKGHNLISVMTFLTVIVIRSVTW